MTRFGAFLLAIAIVQGAVAPAGFAADEPERPATFLPPVVGPQTEARFPPLKLPPGFTATLFACDPLIEYPSVIALGGWHAHASVGMPRVFVAQDYVTGLGVEIVRRDEIRLVEDTDGDGYADKSTLYADGFNSIQGLAYHDGTVYVMHAPLLTALRDTDGDGAADERRDLLSGLGLKPEQNPSRLHCANGVVVGHDGWLYLALGDNGCDVARPEGDRLVFQGGGILRCRRDGRASHVFATGLRNIYDVALDEDLNVFVRNNENDGGDYMIRVCYSFFGADHGYPYLYYERPDEAMPPLADLGRGSSAGGVCYTETAFPPEYRGSLFFCEWGRSLVAYHRRPAGSGFAPMTEIEFAAGAEADPYGLKPTDVIVDHDGSLLVADWADGQRPRRGRGRIYRIRYESAVNQPAGDKRGGAIRSSLGEWIAQLDSESYHARFAAQTEIENRGREGLESIAEALHRNQLGVRGRMHVVWVLAQVEKRGALDRLLEIARNDPEPRVRVQAVRAVADFADPSLDVGEHRGDCGRIAARLASLAENADPRVLREVIVALGRLRWEQAPDWLRENLTEPDAALAHATMQTLRRSGNWLAVLALLDQPDTEPTRRLALRALADRAEPVIVDGLIARLQTEANAPRRQDYADLLTRVHRLPGPWSYWGYRPAPRPANTVDWYRTSEIEAALDRVLVDPDRSVRAAVLKRMQREAIAPRLGTLADWLRDEREIERVAAIIESLGRQDRADVAQMLVEVVADPAHATANRLAAIAQLATGTESQDDQRLLRLAESTEDGPVRARLLRQLGARPRVESVALLMVGLRSSVAEVRSAGIDSLAALGATRAAEAIRERLDDKDAGVRLSAVRAVGRLGIDQASERLLRMAAEDVPVIRGACFDALRQTGEGRGVPAALAALDLGEARLAALEYLGQFGDADHAERLVRLGESERAVDTLGAIVAALAAWQDRADEAPIAPDRSALDAAIARVQGLSGLLLHWRVEPQNGDAGLKGGIRLATGAESRVRVGPTGDQGTQPSTADGWLAATDFEIADAGEVEFLGSSNHSLRVSLDGRLVYERVEPRAFRADSDRFDASLSPGNHHVMVDIAGPEPAEFHLRFRRKLSKAEHETLITQALAGTGNGERGRAIFFNAEKSQCIKCHRMQNEGAQIGPDLTGVGGRFSRIHLVEAILEPSRTIAPSYEAVAVALGDGRVLTGVRVEETQQTLTLGDPKGERHVIRKADIDEIQPSKASIMPDDLASQLSPQEFIDLIAFLAGAVEQ